MNLIWRILRRVADITPNVRVFYSLMGFRAVGVHPHAFMPQKVFDCRAKHHVGAAVVRQDCRNGAIFAEDGFPFSSILFGLN